MRFLPRPRPFSARPKQHYIAPQVLWTALLLFVCFAKSAHASSNFCEAAFLPSEESLYEQGHWQEAAWRAADQGNFERARAIESTLQRHLETAKLVAPLSLMPGAKTPVYLVKLELGVDAVFKPAPKFWQRGIRPWHRDDMPLREVAASIFSRLVHAGLVPVTVEREIDGQVGSLQAYVHIDPYVNFSPRRNLARLKILDFMMRTWDRYPKNWLPQAGAAIDNPMVFQTSDPHPSFGISGPPSLNSILAIYQTEKAAFQLPDLATLQAQLSRYLPREEILEADTRIRALRDSSN